MGFRGTFLEPLQMLLVLVPMLLLCCASASASASAFASASASASRAVSDDGLKFRWSREVKTGFPRSNQAGGFVPGVPLSTGNKIEGDSEGPFMLEFGGWTEGSNWIVNSHMVDIYDVKTNSYVPKAEEINANAPAARVKAAGAVWLNPTSSVHASGAKKEVARRGKRGHSAECTAQFFVGLGASAGGTLLDDFSVFCWAPGGDLNASSWSGVPSARTGAKFAPSARSGARLTVLSGTDALVFAGLNPDGGMMNDVYALDPSARQWKDVDVATRSAKLPEGRSEHGQCSVSLAGSGGATSLVVFGGVRWYRKADNYLNDVWMLSALPANASGPAGALNKNEWEWTELFPRTWPDSGSPEPRVGPSIVPDAAKDAQRIVMYGGYAPGPQFQGRYCEDVWTFDLIARKWAEVFPTGDAPTGRWAQLGFLIPSPLALPSHQQTGARSVTQMAISGGYNDWIFPGYMDDFMILEWQ